MNMNQPHSINFNNPNVHQHMIHHSTTGIPMQAHPQQAMYMSGGQPIPHMPMHMQHTVEYPSNIPSNSYKSTTRHRSTCNI
jgi:hypothetical protein